jgi:serine phosphatase RsbU (regulator of sigma subunit)
MIIMADYSDLASSVKALSAALSALVSGDDRGRELLPLSDPLVGSLARDIELIVGAYDRANARLRDSAAARSKALIDAYNELQRKSDELGRELAMAGKVQGKFIPSAADLPHRPELSCAARYEAMATVGGDYFDVIRAGKNAYAFVMADVTGHGVPAALVTAMLKASFQTKGRYNMKASETFAQINDELVSALGNAELFVTAWLGVLDLENGELRYSNAGHLPTIRAGAKGNVSLLEGAGTMLGAFEGESWEEYGVSLNPGDRLILYTDGITETMDPFDKLFGADRLMELIDSTRDRALIEVPGIIFDAVIDYAVGLSPHDDRAVLALDFISKAAPETSVPPPPPSK